MAFHLIIWCILISVEVIPWAKSFTRLNLGGDKWTVSEAKSGVKVKGSVPGSMYTALYDQGAIQDPLYRDNDVAYAWMGRTDWTYSRNFTVTNDVARSNRVLLVCEGLDTVADVVVNGKVVGSSDNMFVRSIFDVTGLIKNGDNWITVNFKSAVKEAEARVKNSPYIVPPECPRPVQNGECHVNQLRKEQCSFSWDWGPSFPTQGIWKPIYIDAFNSAIIRDLTAVVNKVNSIWQVIVEVYFDAIKNTEVKGQLIATVKGLNLTYSQIVTISAAKNSAKFILVVPKTTNVPLWWPNGYGSQTLFDLEVTLNSGTDKSTRSIKIGFRTVELVQDPVSNKAEQGLTFYFRINGIPIFLKGSNWIPADSFQERITPTRLRLLLESAANVSINSLRVWGGGVYESDEFYKLCDELGIMVWQDLMFSVAMYPTYKAFLDSVATEVTQQLRRLKSHPSIILWAGNNENEKGLRQNWFDTDKNFTLYYNDYVKLYVMTIKPIIQVEDSSREYLVSSPSNGKESDKEGYVAKEPWSELYGDIHFYDYMADQWNHSVFRIPRMASEYGIQAWCNNESLAKVFKPSDFDWFSDMSKHRQHLPMGNLYMGAEVGLHLLLPSTSEFSDYVYLTQINQAMSIRTQTEHYRRYQTRLLPDGRGLTMGALYWQLNDIWQAPTWASIDYEGSWKMLHYYARSFFSKHLISPYMVDSKTLDVYIVVDEIPAVEVRSFAKGKLSFEPMFHFTDIVKSELPLQDTFKVMQKVASASTGYLNVDMYSYDSFKPLFSWTVPYKLKTTAQSVFNRQMSDMLTDSGCPAVESCLLYFTATDHNRTPLSATWYTLTYPKFAKLKPASIKVTSLTKTDLYTFSVEITSDAIALYVWLSTTDVKGRFSDNGFLMIQSNMTIAFHAYSLVTIPQFRSQLKIRSLTDVVYSSEEKPEVSIA